MYFECPVTPQMGCPVDAYDDRTVAACQAMDNRIPSPEAAGNFFSADAVSKMRLSFLPGSLRLPGYWATQDLTDCAAP